MKPKLKKIDKRREWLFKSEDTNIRLTLLCAKYAGQKVTWRNIAKEYFAQKTRISQSTVTHLKNYCRKNSIYFEADPKVLETNSEKSRDANNIKSEECKKSNVPLDVVEVNGDISSDAGSEVKSDGEESQEDES